MKKRIRKLITATSLCLLVSAFQVRFVPLQKNVTAADHSKPKKENASAQSVAAPRKSKGITTWDCIYFGHYQQNKNSSKQPIKWRVLSVEDGYALILSEQNLDVDRYNKIYSNVTWKNSTMRSWLNGYGSDANVAKKDYRKDCFIKEAFTVAERSAIRKTKIKNADNNDYNVCGGDNVKDKIFLLSIDEVKKAAYGFTEGKKRSSKRIAFNTSYAANGGRIESKYMKNSGQSNGYWLRSPGNSNYYAAYVNKSGNIVTKGDYVYKTGYAVRPALYLKLSSKSGYSYADTVSSKDIPSKKDNRKSNRKSKITIGGTEKSGKQKLNNPRITDKTVTWDCLYFGNYWQEDTNKDGKADKKDKKQPIKWRVLSIDGDDALLLSDKNMDVNRYNTRFRAVTWSKCTLRSWLNGYGSDENTEGKDYSKNNFLLNAFSSRELSAIKATTIKNAIQDKVFLLSAEEAKNSLYGFSSSQTNTPLRTAKNTAYVSQGGEMKSRHMKSKDKADWWWLRSNGYYRRYAKLVQGYGKIHKVGINVVGNRIAVRPAIHIRLSENSKWSYAGTKKQGKKNCITTNNK